MNNLPYDMVITFYKNGKFVWETEPERSVDNIINECSKISSSFGDDLNWEIGIVSVQQGDGIEGLVEKIEKLSSKTEKLFE
jgi:hypothetical protein